MTNKEFLKLASKLQKEFKELYIPVESGLAAIDKEHIHVTAKRFHELERENLLEHISKKLNEKEKSWRYEAMTPDGVKIIALESVAEIEDKK